MNTIYTKDGKILKQDNKISVNQNCCCGDCPKCIGSTCCNEEYPRQIGYCCENIWRLPTDIGGCCSGIWYDTAGTCCNEEWHTERGICCNGTTWFPIPEGISLPVWPNPYNPWEKYPGVSWETELCPSGMLFAKYGAAGECCGCVPTGVYDPEVGYEVPFADISSYMCCDCSNLPYIGKYLVTSPYNYTYWLTGCLGTCCKEKDCSLTYREQCNPTNHPTSPGDYEDGWKYLYDGSKCCPPEYCSVDQCCVNGVLVYTATFEVTGDIISTPEGCGGDTLCGSTWIVDIPGTSPTYIAPGVSGNFFVAQVGFNIPTNATLEDVALELYYQMSPQDDNSPYVGNQFGGCPGLEDGGYGGCQLRAQVNGNILTITAPDAINGTITYIAPPHIPLSFNSCFGAGATAKITGLTNGSVSDIEVTNGGSGYAIPAKISPTISISGGSGNGATFAVVLSPVYDECSVISYWTIGSVSIISGGSGYTNNQILSVTAAPGDTVIYPTEAIIQTGPNGEIVAIDIRPTCPWCWWHPPHGAYYREDPTLPPVVDNITITINQPPSNNNGYGAVLIPVVDTNLSSPTFGQIIDITIVNGGNSYGVGQTTTSGPISSSVSSLSRPECKKLFGGYVPGDPLEAWTGTEFVDNNWRNAINCPCKVDSTPAGIDIVEKCCSTAKSSGLGLVFNKPISFGNFRFQGTSRVTVTGTTTSPILVHGTLFGTNATPDKKCPFQHTFVLCNNDGRFNIEPVPCGSSFHNLEVEVCYEKHTITSESFNFSGCNNIQVNLGSCPASCTTTMNYTGPGHTSNATIVLTGNAVIAANGTGPLVLTNNWVPACPLNPGLDLTLTGTNTQNNKLEGCRSNIEGAAYPRLRKDGPGTWWVPGKTCTTFQGFANTAYILDGTLVIQNSRFLFDYTANTPNESEVVVGEQGYSGEVRCFVSLDPESIDGISRNVRVRSTIIVSPGLAQRVLLGAHPEGSPLNSNPPGFIGGTSYGYGTDTGVIELVGDVTLVAPINRTIEFTGTWKTASQTPATKNIRIGHPDFLGTIMLGGIQETTGVVSIEYGKLLLKQGPGSPQFKFTTSLLKIDSNCELIIGQSRTVNSPIELTGNATIISGAGTLDLVSMIISGGDHTISSIVAISSNATITGNGNMLISGIVSGSSTLTMNGSGTIELSGNNSFNGTTIINSGTMKANSLLAFGTGQIVVNAGGTLDKNGFAITNTITNNGGIIIN